MDKKLMKIELGRLAPHPADPFKPYAEDKLRELAESIDKYGLFEPIVVRSAAGVYEILAGKNRANAARSLGWAEIDAFLMDVDDDAALMIITDSNLKHRNKLLPSERGFAYKMQLDAIKRQGE
ncbi:MAG: ParB/RepB/Spo0J family partition protein, partial [Defluviitaleaceae bacterium]|nr:ParB/RepB/Spo0J family partition protein [Defluviitaleaceae bacterium]